MLHGYARMLHKRVLANQVNRHNNPSHPYHCVSASGKCGPGKYYGHPGQKVCQGASNLNLLLKCYFTVLMKVRGSGLFVLNSLFIRSTLEYSISFWLLTRDLSAGLRRLISYALSRAELFRSIVEQFQIVNHLDHEHYILQLHFIKLA